MRGNLMDAKFLNAAAVAFGLSLGLTAALPAAAQPSAALPGALAAASSPSWKELSAPEQQALRPLAGQWDGIALDQKRKWLEVAKQYPARSAQEQQRLHERMSEWGALSQQDRAKARLNFSGAKEFSPAERQEKWQAYQALPEQERNRLQLQGKAAAPQGAAVPTKPEPAQKLATVPAQPMPQEGASGSKSKPVPQKGPKIETQ